MEITKLNCCGQAVRLGFLILNMAFFVVGLTVLAVGIYLLVTQNSFGFVTGSAFSGAALLIVGGVCAAVVSLIAIIGAILLLRPLIVINLIVVTIVVTLEITAGVLAFFFQSDLQSYLESRVSTAIDQYRTEDSDEYMEDVNSFVDFIQMTFTCCGFSGPEDWFNSSYVDSTMMLPQSCQCNESESDLVKCGETSPPLPISFVYSDGCNTTLTNFLQTNVITIGAIGIVLASLEVLGMVMAVTLCACISYWKGRSEETYSVK